MPQMLNAITWEKIKADLTREVSKLDPARAACREASMGTLVPLETLTIH